MSKAIYDDIAGSLNEATKIARCGHVRTMRQGLIEEYVEQRRARLPTLNVDEMTMQEHRYAMGVIEDAYRIAPMRQPLIQEYVERYRASLPILNAHEMDEQEYLYALGVIEDEDY